MVSDFYSDQNVAVIFSKFGGEVQEILEESSLLSCTLIVSWRFDSLLLKVNSEES